VNPPRVHVLPAASFATAQRRHFALSVVLPTLASVAAPWLMPLYDHAHWAAALLLGMWFLVGGVGVSVGLHRHFSHRSFDAAPRLRVLLAVLGGMAAQGTVTYWVSLHRMHHAASDGPGDPHSPQPAAWPGAASGRWASFWRGHIGWVWRHDVPNPRRYARELLADELVRAVDRGYPLWVAAGLVLPGLAGLLALGGWSGFAFGAYWGGVLRIALGQHVIWAINSCCHVGGARPHDTGDCSGNVAWLALPSWGESWHNHHHAAPAQARFGQDWREPDIGWWVVRGFVALGWAKLRESPPAAGIAPKST
jgi:stearoyl-CoA desaturase (Delta-9 desaturase)